LFASTAVAIFMTLLFFTIGVTTGSPWWCGHTIGWYEAIGHLIGYIGSHRPFTYLGIRESGTYQ